MFKTVIIPARIRMFPRAVAPSKSIKTPIPPRIINVFQVFFTEGLSSPTFINTAVKTGLITSATNSEEPSTIIRVMGKYCINSPMSPGQKASGAKAARVVPVEAIIGQATSPTPYLAASNGDNPSDI